MAITCSLNFCFLFCYVKSPTNLYLILTPEAEVSEQIV